MTKITYQIIKHDGGWAFRLGDTISQSFLTHGRHLVGGRARALAR
jgi:hypothetical protein